MHKESSCIVLRVQGEPHQATDDEESKRSLIKSLMKHFVEPPNKNKLMEELFPENDDEEYQDVSQDARDTVRQRARPF